VVTTVKEKGHTVAWTTHQAFLSLGPNSVEMISNFQQMEVRLHAHDSRCRDLRKRFSCQAQRLQMQHRLGLRLSVPGSQY
jgi:hypothetical protein